MLKRQAWFRADSGPPGHWWHRGHFFFAPNPYNMGVYRPKGMQRSLCLFCSQPQQYGCQQTPLDTNSQDLPFWADSGPPGHWCHQGHFFLFQIPTIWVSTDSPGPKQSRFGILSWLRTTWTLGTLRVSGGYFAFFVPNPYNILPGHKIWSRFDILSWIRTTWTLRTPRVCIGHFVFFVPNPYNGCNCLWTPLYPSSQDSAFWADLQ